MPGFMHTLRFKNRTAQSNAPEFSSRANPREARGSISLFLRRCAIEFWRTDRLLILKQVARRSCIIQEGRDICRICDKGEFHARSESAPYRRAVRLTARRF